MSVLQGLEPKLVFHYFEEICNIPHGSGNMKPISDYCVRFAKEHGLAVTQDASYNIILTKSATAGYENAAPIILQGHLDMVCDKTRERQINFETEGLTLQTDGEFVWADGTTLGGDDGIAVAYALAILASNDVKHPKLEVILTTNEEIGLLGAADIDLSGITGKKLINIDSEEEGILLTSCAGGSSMDVVLPIKTEKAKGLRVDLTILGLHGGHSGAEIQCGYANANVLMGRVLDAIGDKVSYQIATLEGGSKGNAIPRHADAGLLLVEQDYDAFCAAVAAQETVLKEEYGVQDPTLQLTVSRGQTEEAEVLDAASHACVLNALMNLPNGIQTMSADIAGLVETSLNCGVMVLENGKLTLMYAVRSAKATALAYLTRRTECMAKSLGGSIQISGEYPGWAYRRDSALRDTVVEQYEKLFGKEPLVQAIHAGLECGLLSDKIEDLDCISFGPDMTGVHTYEERLSIPSTERVWKLLVAVLEASR